MTVVFHADVIVDVLSILRRKHANKEARKHAYRKNASSDCIGTAAAVRNLPASMPCCKRTRCNANTPAITLSAYRQRRARDDPFLPRLQ
jgi:hypothetical protein